MWIKNLTGWACSKFESPSAAGTRQFFDKEFRKAGKEKREEKREQT
jgi:hypothetical protein